MTTSHQLQAVDGPQIIPVTDGSIRSYAVAMLFAEAPSAGTVTVEVQAIGSMTWLPVTRGVDVDVTGGHVDLSFDGAIRFIRVTFSGLVGGLVPILWVSSQDVAIPPLTMTSSSDRMLVEAGLAGSTEFAMRGKLFFGSDLASVASGAFRYYSFTSHPTKLTAVYVRNVEVSEFEWDVDTIIGATYTPGAPITMNNARLGFPNPAGSILTAGATNVLGGTVGQQNMIPGGKNLTGGAAGQGAGVIIYPPGFDAIVRVKNLGNAPARAQIFVVLAEFDADMLP